jgi:hypothetical protein
MHDPLKAGDGLSVVDIRHWPGCGFELSGLIDLGPHKDRSYFLVNFHVRLRPESAEDDYDKYIAVLQANRSRVLARLKEAQATAPAANNTPHQLGNVAKTGAQDKPAPKPKPKPPGGNIRDRF